MSGGNDRTAETPGHQREYAETQVIRRPRNGVMIEEHLFRRQAAERQPEDQLRQEQKGEGHDADEEPCRSIAFCVAMVANKYRRNRLPCTKAPNAIIARMRIDIRIWRQCARMKMASAGVYDA